MADIKQDKSVSNDAGALDSSRTNRPSVMEARKLDMAQAAQKVLHTHQVNIAKVLKAIDRNWRTA